MRDLGLWKREELRPRLWKVSTPPGLLRELVPAPEGKNVWRLAGT